MTTANAQQQQQYQQQHNSRKCTTTTTSLSSYLKLSFELVDELGVFLSLSLQDLVVRAILRKIRAKLMTSRVLEDNDVLSLINTFDFF